MAAEPRKAEVRELRRQLAEEREQLGEAVATLRGGSTEMVRTIKGRLPLIVGGALAGMLVLGIGLKLLGRVLTRTTHERDVGRIGRYVIVDRR
jgi:hypothetical protein